MFSNGITYKCICNILVIFIIIFDFCTRSVIARCCIINFDLSRWQLSSWEPKGCKWLKNNELSAEIESSTTNLFTDKEI